MQLKTIFVCLTIFFSQVHVAETQDVDIVEVANNIGGLAIFLAALESNDLVSTLQGTGPYTVFVPTDIAFDALPFGAVADLFKAENREKLTEILKYHILSEKLLTSSQINAMNLPANIDMLDGGSVTLSRDGIDLKINNATITIPDRFGSNGVIHVIDMILMPSTASGCFTLNRLLLLVLVLTTIFSDIRR